MTYFTENMGNFVAQFNRISFWKVLLYILKQYNGLSGKMALQNISFLVLNTR